MPIITECRSSSELVVTYTPWEYPIATYSFPPYAGQPIRTEDVTGFIREIHNATDETTYTFPSCSDPYDYFWVNQSQGNVCVYAEHGYRATWNVRPDGTLSFVAVARTSGTITDYKPGHFLPTQTKTFNKAPGTQNFEYDQSDHVISFWKRTVDSPTRTYLGFVDLGSYTPTPQAWSYSCAVGCPPDTCEVECGDTICCYNNQGISTFNYPKSN